MKSKTESLAAVGLRKIIANTCNILFTSSKNQNEHNKRVRERKNTKLIIAHSQYSTYKLSRQ